LQHYRLDRDLELVLTVDAVRGLECIVTARLFRCVVVERLQSRCGTTAHQA
jgi:hypothetical protein